LGVGCLTILKELEKIPLLLEGSNPVRLGIRNLHFNKFAAFDSAKNSWLETLMEVKTFLDSANVKYVLIKYLDIPYAYMQDIDLLIEDEKDRHVVFSSLKKKGYTPYSSFLSPHPEKVLFIKHNSTTPIDIYPEPAWWKISYAPKGLITSKRTQKRILGIEVLVPSPTHDLYIIATHGYTHGIVTLADVAYVTKIILDHKVDWHHLLSIAKLYKLEHAVFIYLFLSNMVIVDRRKNQELQKTLEELGRHRLSKMLINLVIRAQQKKKHFPLIIPKSLRSLSALRAILIGLMQENKLSIRELSTYCMLVVGAGKLYRTL